MSPRQVELVIRRDGHPERRVALGPGSVVVGRADDNDIVLSEIGVSRRHARIVVEDDAVWVEDMGSGNGTWRDGERVERVRVEDGDTIVIDPFVLAFHTGGPEPTAEVTAGGDATVLVGGLGVAEARLEVISGHAMAQRTIALPTGSTRTLGRSEKADVVLPEPLASRLHADVGETAGSWWIRDRDSANGTWVNGKRVREKVLGDGDRVRIGAVELRFVAPPVFQTEDTGDHTEAFDGVMFTHALIDPPTSPPSHAPRLDGVPAPPVRPGLAGAATFIGTPGEVRVALGAAESNPLGRVVSAAPPRPAVPPPPVLPAPPRAAGAAPPAPHAPLPPSAPVASSPVAAPPAAVTPAASLGAPSVGGPGPAPRLPAPPAPARPGAVPPPPSLPFGPRAQPRPAPAAPSSAPPPPPPAPAAGGVEIDFDVEKVKARKGPKLRGARAQTGFLSRPINRLSLGILLSAGVMAGGRMVYDFGVAVFDAAAKDDAETEAAPGTPSALPPASPVLATSGLGGAPSPTPVGGAAAPVGGAAAPAASAPVGGAAAPVAEAPTAPAVASPTASDAGADALPAETPPVATVAPGAPAEIPAGQVVVASTRRSLTPAQRDEVAALMAEGMRLFTVGQHFDAATQFYKVQQLDPGHPDAERMGYVACEFIAMQQMFEGLQARSASATERTTARESALAAVAAAIEDASQLAAATQALNAALALLPQDPALVEASARLEERRGAVARGAAVRKEKEKQASLAEMVAAGQREFDRGNLSKAVAQWEAALSADPTRASPQYYQAEEGIRAAKDRMKADSKKAYSAGLAAYKDGDLLTARTQLTQTTRVNPYNDAAAAKLADVRKRLREQASEIYKEARVLEDINQVDKALGLYQRVLTFVDDAGDPLSVKAQGRINALLQ